MASTWSTAIARATDAGTRRMRWPRLLAATLVVALVASCGGDGSNNGASPVPDPGPEATVLAPVATQLPQVETALSKEILADEDVTKPEIERLSLIHI